MSDFTNYAENKIQEALWRGQALGAPATPLAYAAGALLALLPLAVITLIISLGAFAYRGERALGIEGRAAALVGTAAAARRMRRVENLATPARPSPRGCKCSAPTAPSPTSPAAAR